MKHNSGKNWEKCNVATIKESGNKLPAYIMEKRLPQDAETVLNSSEFIKMGQRNVLGAQVYKRENEYYHRDTLHKGVSAHLEVYNKKGAHIGEVDPLTGVLKSSTRDKTKKLDL